MRVTWKLTVASLKMYLRQREAIIWSIVLPLLMIVVFGLIRFDSLGHIDLGIVNEAGEGGKGLIASLTAMKTFNVMEGERESELKALERGDRDIVLAIPASFGAADHDAAPVAYENDARMQQAQLGSLLVQRVLDEKTIAEAHPLHRPMLESRLVKSRNLTTFDFILPGILAMSIMQMGIFGVAFNFVDLKKRGILRRLSVTPINPQNFIVAQVLTRLIVMVAQVVIMVGVGMIFFHLHFIGNPALLMFVALLGAIIFLSLGFALAGISKTEDEVAPLANVISVPMMLLCGVFFSRSHLPGIVHTVTGFFPLTYLADGMRSVAIDGATILQVGPELVGLVAWCAIAIVIAVKCFRWE